MDCESVHIRKKEKAVTLIFNKRSQVFVLMSRLFYSLISLNYSLGNKRFIRLNAASMKVLKD